jgi:hypothetical protein
MEDPNCWFLEVVDLEGNIVVKQASTGSFGGVDGARGNGGQRCQTRLLLVFWKVGKEVSDTSGTGFFEGGGGAEASRAGMRQGFAAGRPCRPLPAGDSVRDSPLVFQARRRRTAQRAPRPKSQRAKVEGSGIALASLTVKRSRHPSEKLPPSGSIASSTKRFHWPFGSSSSQEAKLSR